MYKLQANPKGSRHIVVTEDNLATIDKYALFNDLVESNGFIDDETLEKLRNNIRSYIFSNEDCKDLLDLCYNVVYHDDMKKFGLQELYHLYLDWKNKNEE
jgi:hypothetical protein